jgi:cold shock CspA family protein
MSSNRDSVTPDVASEHLLGRVKWFNNKAGYGFVTVTDGSRSGTDVFVHHSAVNVDSQQYKYLVQGEYIEFDLIKIESDKHEWQASRVSGIRGGKLMCETRHEFKTARNQYNTTKTTATSEEPSMPRQKAAEPRQSHPQVSSQPNEPRQRQPNEPRQRQPQTQRQTTTSQRDGENKEWTLVAGRGVGRPRKTPATSRQSS